MWLKKKVKVVVYTKAGFVHKLKCGDFQFDYKSSGGVVGIRWENANSAHANILRSLRLEDIECISLEHTWW